MTKVVRTFLLWIMLFALPVQGMAQASMFACHLNGDAAGSAQVMDHANMDHATADHSMHAMDSHDHNSADSADKSKKLMKSLHGCCNCAPTCAVVLLPLAQTSFDNIQQDTPNPVSISQVLHSADARRIERPPKTLAI